MKQPVEMTASELLGELNEVERKYAPKKLFIVGRREILDERPRVSIVGSRKPSARGLQRAKKLARIVAERRGVVISGLAMGVDAAAHRAAIEAGGLTVAVIGTSLNNVYPRENAELQELIQQQYLCISQFPIGYPTRRENFPIRNRTMALISDATVIIEAGNTSGSLSQGWEALRLGRRLFISKSLTENKSLSWTREMQAYGAELLSDESLEGFFESLPIRIAPLEMDAVPF